MTPFGSALRGVLLATLLVSAAGCKQQAGQPGAPSYGSEHQPLPQPAEVVAPAPAPTSTTGSIAGVVRFEGGAPPPIRIDTSMDAGCSQPGAPPVMTEQYVVHSGKLANAFITISAGPLAHDNPNPGQSAPVVLDQRHCRFVPHVIAVAEGAPVEFVNSDPTMHNVHTVTATGTEDNNTPVDVSMPADGRPVFAKFAHPGKIEVRCNNHPWMQAFIYVSPSRVFAVSDAQGRFVLNGLPPGAYVLSADHEKFDARTMQVVVKAGQTTNAEFTFTRK
jgi:plastocyanin